MTAPWEGRSSGKGPVGSALADNVWTLRGYPRWRDIWMLIARSAFTQLNRSGTMLLVSVLGMAYLPAAAAADLSQPDRPSSVWLYRLGRMSLAYLPTLYYYRSAALWAPFLPVVALFFL